MGRQRPVRSFLPTKTCVQAEGILRVCRCSQSRHRCRSGVESAPSGPQLLTGPESDEGLTGERTERHLARLQVTGSF